jgi:hypothetical protein
MIADLPQRDALYWTTKGIASACCKENSLLVLHCAFPTVSDMRAKRQIEESLAKVRLAVW